MDTKDLYTKYGLVLRKRQTSNQKIRFLTSLEQDFKDMGFSTSIRKTKLHGKESFSLYVGDVQNAKKVFATTYDTPIQTFLKMPYSPFNDENKKKRNFIGLTLPSLIVFVLGLGIVLYFIKNHWNSSPFSLMSILGYLLTILSIVLARTISKGIVQLNNFNTNTSSIIEILKYAQKNKKTAYVFTDYGTQDNFGYLCLKDYLKEATTQELHFVDSIGNGHRPLLKLNAKEVRDNGLAEIFPNAQCISSGELINGRIVQKDLEEDFNNNAILLLNL